MLIHAVIGCAGESDRGKRPMMTKIATDKSDVTILTSDNPKTEDPCVYFSHDASRRFAKMLINYKIDYLKLKTNTCMSHVVSGYLG